MRDTSQSGLRPNTGKPSHFGGILAAGLILSGLWLAFPRRGHEFEQLIGSCTFGRNTTARLFIGDGGATTELWYSVTVRMGMPWNEHEIFYVYSFPPITGISCEDDRVLITSHSHTWTIKPYDVISGSSDPVIISYGKSQGWGGSQGLVFIDWIRIYFGVAVTLVGVLLLFLFRRKRQVV